MTSRAEDEKYPTIDPRTNPRRLASLVTSSAAQHGWHYAAAVIEKNWDAFANVAPEQLLDAIKALPGDAFVENPGLLVAANYLQQVTISGDPTKFLHDGRLALDPERRDGNHLSNLIVLTGQSAGARTAGRLEEARAAAERAREALLALAPAERAPMVGSLPHLRFQWGRSLDAADGPGALAEYEAAYDLARLTAQPVIARRAAAHIAWRHADRGRLRSAELWLARALAEDATNGRYDVIVFLTSALLKHDRGDPGASRELGRALGLPLGEYWAAALWLSAMLAHTKPGASSVHAELEAELERHPGAIEHGGATARYVRAAQARLARLRPQLRDERPLPEHPSALDLLLASVASYRAGAHRDALAQAEAATSTTAAPRVEAPALLVSAASHLALGHPGRAADAFRHANGIIGRERLFSTYSFLPTETLGALAGLAGEPLHGTDRSPADTPVPGLTRREREVLSMLPTGSPLAAIAAELFISPNTLKATVRSLYRKLGVTSRQEAVDAARNFPR
ncbi:helix-turn-helix transcriptional regulator [Leifsonia sp. F6_8S_P_1B]|uniref:Helix-turn-helix transcriptional regulator n=1 Tax=Leifsonia williamsii TaxID=3035919 RepID=A0ABT8KBC6_9MICO|nr:helix-turn-helix transcriptional regulator [Leifsonia williamsii]MDN4614116.1 helix-turn-helix transcriptional regulator [Leifsonia williamsii]